MSDEYTSLSRKYYATLQRAEAAEAELSATRDRLLIQIATLESDLGACERVNARLRNELQFAKNSLPPAT